MFFELFSVSEDSNPDLPIFPILFSHKNAFEEVYCIAFKLLDLTWDTMNASYMEFPKVIATVKQAIVTALETKPTTLEAFNWATGSSKKTNMFHNDDDNIENEDIKQLKLVVQNDMMEVVKNQKIAIMTEGIYFKLQKPIKGKTSTQTFTNMFVRLAPGTQDEIQYSYCSQDPTSQANTPSAQSQPASTSSNRQELTGSSSMVPQTTPQSPTLASTPASPLSAEKSNPMSYVNVRLTDITFSATAAPTDASRGRQKPDTKAQQQQQQQQHFFQVTLGKEVFDLVGNSRDDHSNFVDCIRAITKKPFECPETIEEYKTLVNLSLKLKLLDLEGVELPKTAPKVPPPPADFNFLTKEVHSMRQILQHQLK
ncbi:hypothetical protein SAMD00019534_083350 [Acytostelium subglobosum LB1]|uniref:hypothetical protein n=1 Tax=Acytostelium subglobosum LB1 TaxID=1410327 RepID=UPI000644EABC|nr:hypothetical protein SAMD00019534_083350 [Acytostelium subglobosum LB1]GAM25160.1 hypothetical protein SAMD00019534_083350 [Acytostelium subglobosum LB1]|eukprot:XP_012751680.1 hypothetical protein SAMD00019534_083350 [Acytostelium subglobosum LB1]